MKNHFAVLFVLAPVSATIQSVGTHEIDIVSSPAKKRKPTQNIQVNSFSKTPLLNLLTIHGTVPE